MKRAWGIAALALLAHAAGAQAPYHDPRKQPRTYTGPGREEPEPKNLREVPIGFFGPGDPRHPEGGGIWQGASLAIEEANREGGYKGLPFRMVAGWSESPWAGGVSRVVKMAYEDRVWAILGGIDGPSTHLAEQVVAKALVTLINPAATDRSVHAANVPWMFSCVPGGHRLAPALAKALGGGAFTLLSATDHDSRAFISELKAALARERLAPRLHLEFEPGARNADRLAGRVSGAAVVIAGPRDSARVIRVLRAGGFAGPVFGGPWLTRAAALEEGGAALEGGVFPLLDAGSEAFRKKFAARYGAQPDYAAAHAYDAASLVVAAIRKAGLNRALIRDAVRELSPWRGVTGTIRWDEVGQNEAPVRLGTVRAGRVMALR